MEAKTESSTSPVAQTHSVQNIEESSKDLWAKRAEENRLKMREYQIKYYEKKKESGLLDRLRECYDKDARKKRYEAEKADETKNVLQRQKEYNLRKKKEMELLVIKNAMDGASEGKRILLQSLIDGGVFKMLTLKQKREILNSK
jgi:hypothetical protein